MVEDEIPVSDKKKIKSYKGYVFWQLVIDGTDRQVFVHEEENNDDAIVNALKGMLKIHDDDDATFTDVA